MKTAASFLDSKVLSRLLALPLNARQAMIGNVSGRHRSPIRGSSIEFSQYRKYVPGDDTRRLDWRTWGRTDRFYIKEFEADTNLRLALIVDASGSMGFQPAGANATRLDFCRKLAGTLGYLAAQQGDAVGLWGVGKDHRQKLPAKRGASHFKLILDQLSSLEPKGGTTILESMHEAAEQIAQRALVVIASDFFVEPAALKQALQHLRFRKHDVVMFHVLDQVELDFTFDRPARFVDMEGGETLLADPSLITRRYREVVKKFMGELDDVIRTTGVDYHRVLMKENYEDVLAKFLLARLQSKGRRH